MPTTDYIERVVNLHIHTVHSDGSGTVPEIAEAASEAGVEVLIVTDHNVYRPEEEGWYGEVLVLVGEELNDPVHPHRNHLLVLGAEDDLATHAATLQEAIAAAKRAGALPFIAHPIEHSGARANEPEINWEDRDVTGLHGVELWNYMSEFKSYIHTVLHGLLYAYLPSLAIRGPYPETLRLWDAMLTDGPCWAVAGSDAHASLYRLGPLRRRILSYRYLFSAVNTHLLLTEGWSGDVRRDRVSVYEALAAGRAFVGYDLAAPTRGARFVGERGEKGCTFGGTLSGGKEARLSVDLPAPASIRLLRNGVPVAEATGSRLDYAAGEPGVYRVEARRRFRGRSVGWVFGNPIIVT